MIALQLKVHTRLQSDPSLVTNIYLQITVLITDREIRAAARYAISCTYSYARVSLTVNRDAARAGRALETKVITIVKINQTIIPVTS